MNCRLFPCTPYYRYNISSSQEKFNTKNLYKHILLCYNTFALMGKNKIKFFEAG